MGNNQSAIGVDSHGLGGEDSNSACPMGFTSKDSQNAQISSPLVAPAILSEKEQDEAARCPVVHDKPVDSSSSSKYKNPYVYNVYGQRIDPTNNMPATPSQEPHYKQKILLPTDRTQSNIRKGGTEGTWLYPSEQMFFNALQRKGKLGKIDETQISSVVAIHNGVNERSWHKVRKWEWVLHRKECDDPTLLRFQGRPDALSPKAFFKHYFLGYPRPFDRHDWFVDRGGLKLQRYVIDYYYDDHKAEELDIHNGFLVPRKVIIDARPAIDDWQSFTDRIQFFFKKPRNVMKKRREILDKDYDRFVMYFSNHY